MKVLQFLALVLTAIALAPAGAHLFALPNKVHLAQNDYFIVQNIYRGWALFGIVLFANLIVTAALAVMVSEQTAPFALVLTSLSCQVAVLAIFFVFVFVFPGECSDQQLDHGPRRLGAIAPALGNGPRRRRGDWLCRLLRADLIGTDDAAALGADQNGISSSMSSRLPPAPAIAGLRAALAPVEPKSPPLSALALAPPPRVSSMVSCELKPCSTTSVE